MLCVGHILIGLAMLVWHNKCTPPIHYSHLLQNSDPQPNIKHQRTHETSSLQMPEHQWSTNPLFIKVVQFKDYEPRNDPAAGHNPMIVAENDAEEKSFCRLVEGFVISSTRSWRTCTNEHRIKLPQLNPTKWIASWNVSWHRLTTLYIPSIMRFNITKIWKPPYCTAITW